VIQKKYQRRLERGGTLPIEHGTIVKKWGSKIPVCIVYPNTYYIGMSNLAVHILYKTLNTIPEVVCERCFLEEGEEPISIESRRPLSSFELVFFTISFELDYINIPEMLRLSSIKYYSKDRKEADPIIVAGGICVMANPEPIYNFIDLFLMGDIETTVQQFMEKYFAMRENKRDEIIEGLSAFDWVYYPKRLGVSYRENGVIEAFSPDDFKVMVNRYKGKSLGISSIITDKTEFSNMLLIEGTRGCPSRCPFCLLGNTYRFIYDDISSLQTDTKDIGIIGGGVSFHPRIVEVMQELKEMGKRVHLPSLRIDEVPLPVIELIKDEVKTLTFGIEAGTERLRRFIGKPLTDNEIFERIETILSIKPFRLKLYFMVGLFGETLEDIDGIVEFAKHVKHIMVKKGAKRGFVGSITVHASPFVPKPSTPFQWLPMNDMTELKDKIGRLKKAFGKIDNTYFTHESIKYSFVQGIFARGDRRISDSIVRFASGDSFTKVLRESPVNLNYYVLRDRAKNEVFPWDFIEGITSKTKLYNTLTTAISATNKHI
jgi:radical SAM superfamily enzyme YgiQ (UPF0313 family)